jgi:hypothetical protein
VIEPSERSERSERSESSPPTTAPDAVASTETPEDPRLAILRAVERGELDIDEAMRRLDAKK